MSVEYSDLESISEKIINILKTKYYNQIINSNHIIIDMFDFINLEFNIYSMFDVFDKLLRSLIVNICIENKFKEILEEELTIEYKNLYGIECNFINLPKYINKIVNIEGNITSFYLPENIAIGYEVLCVKDYNHTHKIRLKNIQNNNNEEDKDVNIYTCRVCGSYASKNVIYKNFCYFILEDLTSNIYTQVMCRCDYNMFLKENLTLSDYIEVIGMVKLDDDNKIFIEVLSILKKSSIYIDQNKVNEVINMLKRFSPKERYEFLVNNFAKHIYGLKMAKEAILLQLASPVLDKPLKRLHLHILLVGDPSTAKSQLLLYVKNIIPKSIYTTGKGSTAAGLGASINKDSKGKFIVAAGALVKSDKSICCIDEFSTMSESDKELLHEVMEQSTCSIAKAGIYMQFNARTRLLCAMNPVNVLYNPYRTLFENTSLKPSLLSRFDIIIVLKDVFDVDYDTNVCKSVFEVDGFDIKDELYTILFYYLNNNTYIPKFTEESINYITNYYISLRKRMFNENIRTIYITPRQIESIKRLCIAYSRLILKDKIEVEDVKQVINFYENTMRSYSLLTLTDQEYIPLKSLISEVIHNMARENTELNIKEIVVEVNKFNDQVDEASVKKFCELLVKEGVLYKINENTYKVTTS